MLTPRSSFSRFLELLALVVLAIAQPLFDLLGRNAAFFVAHRTQPLQIVLFALALTAGLAGALVAAEVLVSWLNQRASAVLHQAWIGLLGTLLALLALKRITVLPLWLGVAGAVSAGIGLGLLSGFRGVRSYLRVLGGLACLLPLYFLLLSPASRLVFRAAPVGAAMPVSPSSIPVVVIVFDELPLASLLDSRGLIADRRFPAFAALAARSTWYRRATSVAAATELAVPALLTGRYPDARRLPVAADYPNNLFALLGGSHQVHAQESLTLLCPAEVCGGQMSHQTGRWRSLWADAGVVYLHLVLPSALAVFLPPISGTWGEFGVELAGRQQSGTAQLGPRHLEVEREVETFLSELDPKQDRQRQQQPGLYYLHLEVPHIPWRYLPSGREYGPISTSFFAHGVANDTTWRPDEWLIAQGLQRHLLQLAYADHLLAKLIAGLEAGGLGEEALWVVVADHGLAFQAEQPGRIVTDANCSEVLSVPLFIKLPGQASGTVSLLPAQIIDVLPTIADVIGLYPMPWSVDGESLLRPETFPQRVEFVAQTGESSRSRFPLAKLAEDEQRAVARITDLFGDNRPPADLFDLGTRPELAGRRVQELGVADRTAAGVALEQPWFFDRVDPQDSFVPAQVVGRLVALPGRPLEDQQVLAVVVNSEVRATTRSFRSGTVMQFSAMVPEEAFVRGRNVVEVFLVEDGSAPPRLAPTVDLSGPRYRLRRSAAGEVLGIEASNGTACTLQAGAVTGGLAHEEWYVAGWADAGGDWPFTVVMVFVDGELTHVTTTGQRPPAASEAADRPALERAGFRFAVPDSLRHARDGELRVFGVAGPLCSELFFEDATGGPLPGTD